MAVCTPNPGRRSREACHRKAAAGCQSVSEYNYVHASHLDAHTQARVDRTAWHFCVLAVHIPDGQRWVGGWGGVGGRHVGTSNDTAEHQPQAAALPGLQRGGSWRRDRKGARTQRGRCTKEHPRQSNGGSLDAALSDGGQLGGIDAHPAAPWPADEVQPAGSVERERAGVQSDGRRPRAPLCRQGSKTGCSLKTGWLPVMEEHSSQLPCNQHRCRNDSSLCEVRTS